MSAESIPDTTPSEMSASTADSFVLTGVSTPSQQQPLFGQTRVDGGGYDDDVDDGDDDDDADELDSLPSISTSILSPSYAGSVTSSDAQHEWEASLEQLQLMLTMVLVPFIGKYLGRKFAYWSEYRPLEEVPHDRIADNTTGWARYMEYAHNVQIKWTNRREFNAVGVAAAAATI
ncbi:hypothetical protein F503_03697 [Ophiostoma piceae UAMH 11346]|uniref:Uncharacterized protein n=1 Tax=Ophiostoma piceae (strain UAMH 11346) TaxID=1262450 RepID=S3BX16_OPHP1|nr:hypothetical protein F503_03697 [Ophiostoma piceae UAMH 11346]